MNQRDGSSTMLVVNMDVVDRHEESAIAAPRVLQLCRMVSGSAAAPSSTCHETVQVCVHCKSQLRCTANQLRRQASMFVSKPKPQMPVNISTDEASADAVFDYRSHFVAVTRLCCDVRGCIAYMHHLSGNII